MKRMRASSVSRARAAAYDGDTRLAFVFIWLRPAPQPKDKYIFPEDSHGVPIVANILAYGTMYPGAARSIWYDAKFVTQEQLSATALALPGVVLREVGLLRTFVNVLEAAGPLRITGGAPLLFRVDLLKLMLQQEALVNSPSKTVCCIVDMDISPKPLVNAFNEYNLRQLRNFGVMWAWKELCDGEIENGVAFTCPRIDMEPRNASIAQRTLEIAVRVSMERLKHCACRSALNGAVYFSLTNAVTWMVGQHYSAEVDYVTPAAGTDFLGHPAHPRMRPLPLHSTLYNPFAHDASPDAAALSQLVIEMSEEEGAYDETTDRWFIVTADEELVVAKRDGSLLSVDFMEPMQRLCRYHEMPSHLLPIMYVLIGSTLGAESWSAADAGIASSL